MNATALDRPLSILIVDDEPPARRRLRSLLAAHPTARVVAEAAGVAEARARLNERAPDLAFLDIQLSGEDAFALLSGAPLGTAVVFVTAHAEHALRGSSATCSTTCSSRSARSAWPLRSLAPSAGGRWRAPHAAATARARSAHPPQPHRQPGRWWASAVATTAG